MKALKLVLIFGLLLTILPHSTGTHTPNLTPLLASNGNNGSRSQKKRKKRKRKREPDPFDDEETTMKL